MNDNERQKTNWVRYEVILPCEFNDGTSVPPESFQETYDEVLNHFGAITLGSGSFCGSWKDENGLLYDDTNFHFFVDTRDTEEALAWIRDHKEKWRLRFQQRELWITRTLIQLV